MPVVPQSGPLQSLTLVFRFLVVENLAWKAYRALFTKFADSAESGGVPDFVIFFESFPRMRNQILSALIATALMAPVALAQDAGKPKPSVPQKSDVPVRPLDSSDIVVKSPGGGLVVGQKNGKGVDGIKLSQHDMDIGSAVAPDGTIHVAFVEQHGTHLYDYSVYHRSSSDGGKAWTETKNLSEDMPGVCVGRCYVLTDPRNRVYVIWRAGLKEGFIADIAPYGGHQCNLWFRVFEAGKWSKPKLVGPAGSAEKQNDGTLSYFATIDDAGRPQVVWNSIPDKWHSELCYPTTTPAGTSYSHRAAIGNGLVFQATLEGTNVSPPHEIFLHPHRPSARLWPDLRRTRHVERLC